MSIIFSLCSFHWGLKTHVYDVMVLQPQRPASHNAMLGQRISHPPSTKFDEDFELPAAKRLKRSQSADTVGSHSSSSSEESLCHAISLQPPREIPDSEGETDEENPLPIPFHRTDLESALPQVQTDKEAIAEYEATRAAESEGPDLQERLGQRRWIPGKSSIYVDAFNLALETVLEEESYLFDAVELAVFEQWRQLSYEGQYL